MFTMKNLDAYRMQLWGKMAAQHHAHQNFLAQQQQQQQQQQQPQQHQSQLTGHAAGLRPAYLSSHALSPKGSIASSNSSLGGTLAALLSGKHTPSSSNSGLLTPPASPRLGAQSARPSSSSVATQKEREREREREAQAAVLAVVASQTLFKKLGNAFWDAFSGSSSSASPSSSSSSSSGSTRNWDADKVRRVLEGKAVVKVVDVEPAVVPVVPSIVVSPAVSVPASVASVGVQTGGGAPSTSASTREVQQQCGVHKKCEEMKGCVSEILEESMRSLTLGHKGGAPARRL
ncbi:hypothetical protein P691DRAFT_779978 [Macrolepiota fuliginosa MF-IS2]|nr:hypothetical protein P691DRAFT_779978 [Macrolepiota fuliginosa MF-IS2]